MPVGGFMLTPRYDDDPVELAAAVKEMAGCALETVQAMGWNAANVFPAEQPKPAYVPAVRSLLCTETVTLPARFRPILAPPASMPFSPCAQVYNVLFDALWARVLNEQETQWPTGTARGRRTGHMAWAAGDKPAPDTHHLTVTHDMTSRGPLTVPVRTRAHPRRSAGQRGG